jgi:hypothetical protein
MAHWLNEMREVAKWLMCYENGAMAQFLNGPIFSEEMIRNNHNSGHFAGLGY